MKKTILISVVTLITSALLGQSILDLNGNLISDSTNNSIEVPEIIKGNNLKSYNSATIINVIPSPTPYIGDIAFDGENLWVEGYDEFVLFKISPIDGTIIKTIPTTAQRPYGLTFDGQYLWLADTDSLLIQKIDTLNGNILLSFPTPADPNESYPEGLAWDGNSLWNNDVKNSYGSGLIDSLFQISTNGNLISSFHHFLDGPTGLAFDGTYLWSTDNVTDKIYKIDTSTLLPVDTLDAPGGTFPNGLTFDGQYLWLANGDKDSLYQIDVGYTTTESRDLLIMDNHLVVYPNPSSGKFIINGNIDYKMGDLSIIVYDVNGKLVLNKNFRHGNLTTIKLDEYKSGMYFYTIRNKNRILNSGKLIKE